jgi:hypothetical protein
MYAKKIKTFQRILMRCFLKDRVIQEEGLYVYKIQYHFSISVVPCVRSQGGSLVTYKYKKKQL